MKDIPFYDLHVVQRDANIADYKERGARDVIKIQTAYEPTIHFPPPAGWSDADRDREVSFIGTPYDQRGGVPDAAVEGVRAAGDGLGRAGVEASI